MNLISGERKDLWNGWYLERRGYGDRTVWTIHDPLGNEAGNVYGNHVTSFLTGFHTRITGGLPEGAKVSVWGPM